MKSNIVITTGGSGGHVVPATILYEHLSEKTNVIITIDNRGLKYLDKSRYQYKIINTPKLNNFFFLPLNILLILSLVIKSIFLLKKNKVKKIISTGGYMSLPVIIAAKILKISIYLTEPNLVLGRANKFFLGSCKNIFCYSDKIKNFPPKFIHKIVIINPLVKKKVYDLMWKDLSD